MNSRALAFPLIVIVAILIGGACTVGGNVGSGGAFVPLSCAADGNACVINDDCCNYACAGGVCDASQTCTLDNDPCTSDAECCSSYCDTDGYCGLAATSCVPDGSPCGTDYDCCNYACAGGVCDSAAVTCGVDGDPCTSDAECCSNYCYGNATCSP